MKSRKEVRIGLTIVVVISIFVWGINFIKGKNLFKGYNYYYAVFDDVQGLSVANPVYYNGYKIGHVQDITFSSDNSGNLLVSLTINHGIDLPIVPKAIIYTSDLMGTKAIKLVPCKQGNACEPGDTLPTGIEDIMASLESFAIPIKTQVSDILNNLDRVLKFINDSTFKNDLSSSAQNLNSVSSQFKNELPDLFANTNSILASVDSVTKELNSTKYALSQSINNIEAISDSLKQINFAETIQSSNAALEKINLLLTDLYNDGKTKELIENDSLYINLINASKNLEVLLKDIQENPKKYVKFSLF